MKNYFRSSRGKSEMTRVELKLDARARNCWKKYFWDALKNFNLDACSKRRMRTRQLICAYFLDSLIGSLSGVSSSARWAFGCKIIRSSVCRCGA